MMVTQREGLGRNQQLIGSAWYASLLKPRAKQSVYGICGHLEGQEGATMVNMKSRTGSTLRPIPVWCGQP
jgi:hypothetical protein